MSRAKIGEAEGGLTMRAATKPALVMERRAAVAVGLPTADSAEVLVERVKEVVPSVAIACVDTVERLLHAAKNERAELIVVDDRILGSGPLAESIEPLAAIAAVVLIAAYERHGEIGRLVAAGRA